MLATTCWRPVWPGPSPGSAANRHRRPSGPRSAAGIRACVCHQSVGADAYARAEAEGARANAAEALAYANRGRGARLRPASGSDSLTPTEIRVAAAVSDGLSNPRSQTGCSYPDAPSQPI